MNYSTDNEVLHLSRSSLIFNSLPNYTNKNQMSMIQLYGHTISISNEDNKQQLNLVERISMKGISMICTPLFQIIDAKNKRCVKPRACPNVCTLPQDPGRCKAHIPSYFFNSTSKR